MCMFLAVEFFLKLLAHNVGVDAQCLMRIKVHFCFTKVITKRWEELKSQKAPPKRSTVKVGLKRAQGLNP
jgi:hypothetical protein